MKIKKKIISTSINKSDEDQQQQEEETWIRSTNKVLQILQDILKCNLIYLLQTSLNDPNDENLYWIKFNPH